MGRRKPPCQFRSISVAAPRRPRSPSRSPPPRGRNRPASCSSIGMGPAQKLVGPPWIVLFAIRSNRSIAGFGPGKRNCASGFVEPLVAGSTVPEIAPAPGDLRLGLGSPSGLPSHCRHGRAEDQLKRSRSPSRLRPSQLVFTFRSSIHVDFQNVLFRVGLRLVGGGRLHNDQQLGLPPCQDGAGVLFPGFAVLLFGRILLHG